MADMQESFKKDLAGNNALRLGMKSPRLCDGCDIPLVAPSGIVVETTFFTEYGLMCSDCVMQMLSMLVYKPGEDVSDRVWY